MNDLYLNQSVRFRSGRIEHAILIENHRESIRGNVSPGEAMKPVINPRIDAYSFRCLAAASLAAALIVFSAASFIAFDYSYNHQLILLIVASSVMLTYTILIDLLFISKLYQSKTVCFRLIDSRLIARNLFKNHTIYLNENVDLLIKGGHNLIGGSSSRIWTECAVIVNGCEAICVTSFIKNAPRLIEDLSTAHLKLKFEEFYRKIEQGSAIAFRPVWICGSTLIVDQLFAINLNDYNGCSVRGDAIVLNPRTGSKTVAIDLDKTVNSHLLYIILRRIFGCENPLSDLKGNTGAQD